MRQINIKSEFFFFLREDSWSIQPIRRICAEELSSPTLHRISLRFFFLLKYTLLGFLFGVGRLAVVAESLLGDAATVAPKFFNDLFFEATPKNRYPLISPRSSLTRNSSVYYTPSASFFQVFLPRKKLPDARRFWLLYWTTRSYCVCGGLLDERFFFFFFLGRSIFSHGQAHQKRGG